uniref:Uncharacterized protein n=1 Tax=Chromera velia CCMP2878 TaxID=1169474 RepID=A0A0G4IBY8_9ALVE|eukprot:Cvel_2236.t1-p1 / transcript=Cvel_2236.t1 / gene=Cvel_2236 / organism=Chromera_velia_CCMP2878 / gene_product=hypothetical protein / transcript_product=hypothetical protein / location=Cvel_scaffold86:54188-54811(+) / protein_length=208 / sequence_SO=supercontig / SO=protein_coding / is_pseudo=false
MKKAAAAKPKAAAAKAKPKAAAPKAKPAAGKAKAQPSKGKPEPVQAPEVPPREPVKGKVTLKFMHYTKEFEISDGVLNFGDLDEVFGLCDIFKRATFHLKGQFEGQKNETDEVPRKDKDFVSLLPDQTYTLSVEEPDEDPEEDAKPKRIYNAEEAKALNPMNAGKSNKGRMDAITDELKKMTQEELREKGDRYKELIEARDLEDCLYG